MKKVTRILSILLVLSIIIGAFAGCGNKEGKDEKAKGEAGETVKVAVITKPQDMFGAWVGVAFRSEGEKYGYKVDVFDHAEDQSKYLEIMDNVAQSSYDLVVSQTPKMDARNAIESVQESGAVFFHISSQGWEYIRDEGIAQGVTCNEYALGEIVARQAVEDLPQDANVVVLLGPAGRQNSIDRNQAYIDILGAERPDVTILDAQIANWNKDEGMAKMDDWLQVYDKIDGVFAVNDGMATGAIESLLGNGFNDWDNMFVYGVDGLTDACTYIIDGYMTASAVQDATAYADKAFTLFSQHQKGEYDMNAPMWYEFQPSLVTKENAEEQLKYYEETGILK